MKTIIVKEIYAENFKRFKSQRIDFGDKVTAIFGQNYRGKSSVADAFSWVMFNKSSTGNTEGSQFRPRRYDENGVNIDYVDVVVELVLLIDGDEVKIRKVQRQNWVRHKGDDYDSYEGDKTEYEWNDAPVTPTEHKKRVAAIISEDVFRMISNPAAFPSMDAKKQREFLLKNIARITDDDVFAISPEFEPVRAAKGKGTLEELIAKTKKEIAAYKKKQEELPVRIDQESKSIVEMDFSETERLLEKLKADLAENEAKIEDTGKAYEEINALKAKKAEHDMKLIQISGDISRENAAKERELQALIDKASADFNLLHEKQKNIESALQIKETLVTSNNERLAGLREKYLNEVKREIGADSFICPVCGQDFPAEKAEEIKAHFEQEKAAAIKGINEEGTKLSEAINTLKSEIEGYKGEIEALKVQKIEAMRAKNAHTAALNDFKPVMPEENSGWQEVKAELNVIESKIANIHTEDADALKAQLKAERATIQDAIDKAKEVLASKSAIEKSKATVEELKAEMVQVTQNLANCEKLDRMIEKFNRAKMDMLSERINVKFKVVRWKLFEQQKNGGIAETCVCMVNGSCYGENTTSATERMMAGMDIISTLQEIYQVEAPIFLDDADLYNGWNIPDMNCQLIKLCVSEDEELRVEVK